MTPDAQLLIRTHLRDLDWLQACLWSVRKFWRSQYPPVIVATPDCEGLLPAELKELGGTVHFVPQWADQRAGANYIGLTADLYTDAPIILQTDSDCLFRMPVSTLDFMQGDKIMIHGETWDTINEMVEVNKHCIGMYRVWIKESTGLDAQYETMRHHPFMFWREDFAGVRDLVHKTTGYDVKDWIQDWSRAHHSGQASEFNLLGAYCLKGDRPYVRMPTILWEKQKIRQFHSWSQTPYSRLEEIGAILG